MSFVELGLNEPILRALTTEGYSTPTPIQAQAIPHVLNGFDLLGCAQTGTGKTAAFALPVLQRLMAAGPTPRGRGRKIRTLVLSPTRELAVQIADSFRAYGRHTGLRHTIVVGGVSQRPQVRDLQHGVDTLIATPGRLVDLYEQGFVDLSGVEIFVLDEADRMLDMGFMPALRRIINWVPSERQTLFFSATMPPEIEQLAQRILHNPVQARIAPAKATTELIEQQLYMVPRNRKTELLTHFLQNESISRAIVFTRTKHGADRVTRQLEHANVKAEAIHGNKSQNARQRTLYNFKSGRITVLVATDVAARGLDIDGVSHVFNYDLPHEPETYVHRIGRTGRAGATGVAIAFCDAEERQDLLAIERLLKQRLTVLKNPLGGPEPEIHAPEPIRAPVNHGRPHGQQRPAHASRGRRFAGKPKPAWGGIHGRTRKSKERPAGGFAR
jgi:ATP-dependent RNA helicase RhlE